MFLPVSAGRVVCAASACLLVTALSVTGCTPASEPTSPPPSAPASPASAPGLTTVVGTAPRGAIVVLEPTVSHEFPLPGGPAVMDQFGKQFVPGLLMVRVGQPVEFRNSEDTPHNVYVTRSRTGAEVLNVSTDPFERYTHTFDRPGQYEVSCDIHPGMLATVVATATPYTAVADDRGTFTILDVPAGSYKLTASASGRDTERTIEVSGARTEVGLPSS